MAFQGHEPAHRQAKPTFVFGFYAGGLQPDRIICLRNCVSGFNGLCRPLCCSGGRAVRGRKFCPKKFLNLNMVARDESIAGRSNRSPKCAISRNRVPLGLQDGAGVRARMFRCHRMDLMLWTIVCAPAATRRHAHLPSVRRRQALWQGREARLTWTEAPARGPDRQGLLGSTLATR